jgi:hypothetical protein
MLHSNNEGSLFIEDAQSISKYFLSLLEGVALSVLLIQGLAERETGPFHICLKAGKQHLLSNPKKIGPSTPIEKDRLDLYLKEQPGSVEIQILGDEEEQLGSALYNFDSSDYKLPITSWISLHEKGSFAGKVKPILFLKTFKKFSYYIH